MVLGFSHLKVVFIHPLDVSEAYEMEARAFREPVALLGDRRWLRAAAVSCEQPRHESAGVKVPSIWSGLAVFLLSPTHMLDNSVGAWGPLRLHPPPPRTAGGKCSSGPHSCAERGSPSPSSASAWGDEEALSSAPKHLRSLSPISDAAPPRPANARSPGAALPGCGSLLGPCL